MSKTIADVFNDVVATHNMTMSSYNRWIEEYTKMHKCDDSEIMCVFDIDEMCEDAGVGVEIKYNPDIHVVLNIFDVRRFAVARLKYGM